MDKLDSTSMNLEKYNIEKLKELFPNCVTEGKIDFDILREMLGDEVDNNREKYQFTWNGKAQAIKIAQMPSTATLRPCKEKSKDWDSTENLYIEGDNLEVLKQLQKTYFGKIKVIYIDPPYNRGTDLIYKDNYHDSFESYLNQTSQGTSSNPETSGRFHTDWLNMMYPRLILSRNLLTDGGCIFISIDDNELYNLKKICDEIYGEQNFVNCIVVKSSEPTGVKMTHANKKMPKLKEYVLVYKKGNINFNYDNILIPIDSWGVNYKSVIDGKSKLELDDIRGYLAKDNVTDHDVIEFDKKVRNLKLISFEEAEPKWKTMSEEQRLNWKYENAYRIVREVSSSSAKALADKKSEENDDDFFGIKTSKGKLYLIKNHYNKEASDPNIKLLFAIDYLMVNPCDLWTDIKTTRLDQEGDVQYNNGKKPKKLINRLMSLVLDKNDDIVLDFFAGSATTGHSIFELNLRDYSNKKFILVQLPENLDASYERATGDQKKDIKELIDFLDSIGKPHILSEIGIERLNRSGEQIKSDWMKENKGEGLFIDHNAVFPLDIGYKVFKQDSTNIKQWDNCSVLEENGLALYNKVFKEGRSKEDVLYEIMLKYGIFDMKTSEVLVNGKKMYKVGLRFMLVCLEDNISSDDIKAICEEKPKYVVFKEEGFANDNDKINAEYNLKKAGVEEVKCI